MRKRTRQYLAPIFAIMFVVATIASGLFAEPSEVKAVTVTEVDNAGDFANAFNGNGDVFVKLTANITLNSTCAWTSTYNMTIDLNNYTLTAPSGQGAITLSGGTLTVTDSSSAGGGKITSSADPVSTIQTTGGTLVISGGIVQSGAFTAVNASNTNVEIRAGRLVGVYSALTVGDGCTATIGGNGGNPQLESTSRTILMEANQKGSLLNIQGGNFSSTNSQLGYVCEVNGTLNRLTIAGGTFTLNAPSGSSLVIGSDMQDSNVSVSGGTYNKRIARIFPSGTSWDYTAYYGNGTSGSGVLAPGYVLTNNTLTDLNQNTAFTADSISVVPGVLLILNTRRSAVETYGANETDAANAADVCSLDPISVGANGTVYSNTNSGTVPAVDSSKVQDENTYTFFKWYDSGNQAYDSVSAYLAKNKISGTTTLYAGWKANTGSSGGFDSAMGNSTAVKTVSSNLASGQAYKLGSGSWKVSGDNTVYSGNTSFYVTSSGAYTFEKQ